MTDAADYYGYFPLGSRIRDKLTHIEGVLIAFTDWHDRSQECAIQREGLNSEGEPFAIHWFPVSRMEAV
jgi:hypothetical protein